jgi:hypothetical protein
MKTKRYSIVAAIVFSLFSVFSCTEYLDKSVLADITSDDVFQDFNKFQGFVETMYAAVVVPYKSINTRPCDPNFGDDVITTGAGGLGKYMDNGNYMGVVSSDATHFFGTSANANDVLNFTWSVVNQYPHTIWGGWKAIRVANIALANLDKLQGTQEEADLLAGQAYFFRAYFHWEIMRIWGAIPYVGTALDPSSDMKVEVLDFHQTADSVMRDFQRAADLLPLDWDLTEVGQRTLGNNNQRLVKGMAVAFMSEVMLWCGSPLVNGTVTGSYEYDHEYLKLSAEYALDFLEIADQGYYEMEPMNTRSEVFYVWNDVEGISGKKEKIFAGIKHWMDRWNSGPYMQFSICGGGGKSTSPNAKYVEKYGMANGLPIDDPASGYDPNNPFDGRDPRFYTDLRWDRSRQSEKLPLTDARATCQLYIGGRERSSQNSETGYGMRKFMAPQINTLDGWPVNNYRFNVPRLRLPEIYLFYAEAVNEVYGPTGTMPGASLTAVQAVNIVRNRATLPNLDPKFYPNKDVFREVIRDERAVELSFEMKRWYDLRRWYVAHLPEHKMIYKLDFDKNWTYFELNEHFEKVFDMKHYWMPFPTEQVSIYDGWKQNPGW